MKKLLSEPAGQRWSVIVVVLLGLLARMHEARTFNRIWPDSAASLRGDEPGYNNTALELLAGLGFTWPGRVPLYPIWLAGVHWMTGTSYHGARYVQSFLGAVTVLLTYLLGRRVFGHTAGLLAALFAAASLVLIHQSSHLLSEVLFTPTVLLTVLVLWRAFETGALWRFALAGALVGVTALIRPTLLFFPVFLVVIFVFVDRSREMLRRGLVLTGATLVVISPWLIRNRLHYDAWFPLATSNAILWQGSPEYYRLIHDYGYTYDRIWSEVIYGPNWREHDPTSIEGDRYWTARALRSIRDDPLTYLRFSAEKLVTFWTGDPNADWNNERVFSYPALRRVGFTHSQAVAVIIARVLPLLVVFAIAILWKDRRRLFPIYGVLLYCTLLHAATHAEARLSEPLQPFLLILLSGASIHLWNQRAVGRRQPELSLP